MNLLIEIGVEELPAEYARRAWQELAASKLLAEALGGAQFIHTRGIEGGLYTPRRLALVAAGFAEKHPDVEVKVSGPARKAAYDAEGKPTRALEGFLKGQGLTAEQVFFETTPKGEYVAARVTRRGARVKDALEKAIPQVLASLSFPKTMRWEASGVRFARPVRWIVALLGGEPLALRFADVAAGTRSCGHRFQHPGYFEVSRVAPGVAADEVLQSYGRPLADHGVMVSADRRRAYIRSELRRLAASLGGSLLEDEELVDITADLVEWPVVVAGAFDRTYLRLPREVIVTAMREHQRYFAALGPDGSLLPNFLCVANASRAWFEESARATRDAGLTRGLMFFLEAGEPGAEIDRQPGVADPDPESQQLDAVLAPIARGNERVLRARLDDATFYWETDLARWRDSGVGDAALGAAVPAEPLKGVAWLEGWGSVYDRAARVAALVERLGPAYGLSADECAALGQAAWLMKLDLTTDMIKDGKEFTSLEGRMGALYGAACGLPGAVTVPMAEHYYPRESVTEVADRAWLLRGEGDGSATRAKLPSTKPARVLALLDKLDSLAGFFAAGKIPTGSEDPFGVRRVGNGLVALLLQMEREAAARTGSARPGHATLSSEEIDAALGGYGAKLDAGRVPAVRRQVFEFLLTRLRAFLADESTEAANATLAAGESLRGEVFDPADAASRARHMSRLLTGEAAAADREELFGLSTLFKRVSNILKDQQLPEGEAGREAHDPQERALLEALDATEPKVLECYETRAYDEALKGLLRLRAPIDRFFEEVMVLAEDPAARERRLKLLRRIQRLFLRGWDFSQVSVPASVS